MNLPLVNVTLPVFNEEDQLAWSLGRLKAFLAQQRSYRWEIVIAENGSTDRTWELAQRLASSGVSCVHLDQAGRGGALKRVWMESPADVVSYMDIDLSTDLAHFPELIGRVMGGECDLAIGSRLSSGSHIQRSLRREVLSRGYNRLLRWALGTRIHDAQCGFKAVSRQAAQALLPQVRDSGWFFDTELVVLAERQGYRVAELPVNWVEDADSRVRIWETVRNDLKGVWRMRRQCHGRIRCLRA